MGITTYTPQKLYPSPLPNILHCIYFEFQISSVATTSNQIIPKGSTVHKSRQTIFIEMRPHKMNKTECWAPRGKEERTGRRGEFVSVQSTKRFIHSSVIERETVALTPKPTRTRKVRPRPRMPEATARVLHMPLYRLPARVADASPLLCPPHHTPYTMCCFCLCAYAVLEKRLVIGGHSGAGPTGRKIYIYK